MDFHQNSSHLRIIKYDTLPISRTIAFTKGCFQLYIQHDKCFSISITILNYLMNQLLGTLC